LEQILSKEFEATDPSLTPFKRFSTLRPPAFRQKGDPLETDLTPDERLRHEEELFNEKI